MKELSQTHQKLPLPKWCFILLGIPTFYMPLAYLAVVVWTIGGEMLLGLDCASPKWMMTAIQPALYVTFAMWPVYMAWVLFSKRLAWGEKLLWLFIVIFLNMAGMPMFYVFMIRRYLGLEGRMGKRDDISLDLFLKRHEIAREKLSPSQLGILRFYCRNQRLNKWAAVLLVAVAALALYTAVVLVPKKCVRSFADSTPTRVVIIDSVADTKKEIVPEPETLRLHVQNVMIIGAMAGMIGTMGLFLLAQAISLLLGNLHRKALIDFMKATDNEHSASPYPAGDDGHSTGEMK